MTQLHSKHVLCHTNEPNIFKIVHLWPFQDFGKVIGNPIYSHFQNIFFTFLDSAQNFAEDHVLFPCIWWKKSLLANPYVYWDGQTWYNQQQVWHQKPYTSHQLLQPGDLHQPHWGQTLTTRHDETDELLAWHWHRKTPATSWWCRWSNAWSKLAS